MNPIHYWKIAERFQFKGENLQVELEFQLFGDSIFIFVQSGKVFAKLN